MITQAYCLRVGALTRPAAVRLRDAALVLLIFFLLQFSTIAMGELVASGAAGRAALPLFGTFIAALGVAAASRGILGSGFTAKGLQGIGVAWISRAIAFKWILFGALTGGIVTYLTYIFPHVASSEHSPAEMFLNNGLGVIVIWVITAIIIAPIVEEFVFRGFILSAVSGKVGTSFGIVVSAAAFLVIHLPQIDGYWLAGIALFILGLLSGIARINSGSLVAPILFHCCYNTVAVINVLLQN